MNNCKKCGAPLIRESKRLVGLMEERSLSGYKLKYEVGYSCPAFQKPFGWLLWGHDRITVVEHS